MGTTEITEISPEQEKTQIAEIAKASILNIEKNKQAYEELRDEYTGITLPEFKDSEFKKTLKRLTEGSGKLVKARTAADKLVKSEIAMLDEVKTMIKSAGEDLKAITADTEKEVKSLKETAEGLVEDAKQEELRLLEEKKQARIAKLFELGLKFNGAYYEIGELNITPIQVTQYSEAQFEGFISQATVAYEAEQLRLAEEREAEEKRIAEEKKQQEQLAEAHRKEQEALTRANADKQSELDAINREREIMRLERTEARIDTLRRYEFLGSLKEGKFTRVGFILKAEFVVDAPKSEWDAKMAEWDAYLVETIKSKETKPQDAPVVLDTQVRPLNGSPIHFTEEEKESILNDVLVIEEAVKQDNEFPVNDEMVINVLLKFSDNKPFIDTAIGKSTLRIYVEQFLDTAQDGLSADMVAASGSIGDELLFLVIKGK